MSEILVVSADPLNGDAVATLPTICGLAEKYDTVYLAMRNRAVLEIALLPENVVDVMGSEPRWVDKPVETLWLTAGAACDYDPGKQPAMSLIHHYMLRAGLGVDRDVLPQPKVKIADGYARSYNVILAPWTSARERTMTTDQVQDLMMVLEPLEGRYGRLSCPGLVAIVGGARDGRQWPSPGSGDNRGWFPPWGFEHGRPFSEVGKLMQEAKCVVTVDSFPSRLAHAAGVGSRHIILDSGVTPWKWQSHPGAIQVKGRLVDGQATWDIDSIVEAVNKVLA